MPLSRGIQPLARRSVLAGLATTAAAFAAGDLVPGSLRSVFGPTPDEMLYFFDTLALRTAQPDGPAEPGWIRKWTAPVEVRVFGFPGWRRRAELATITARLERWTGLPFRMVAGTADSGPGENIVVLRFLDPGEMAERYHGPVCHCATYGNGGRLHTGVIDVSSRFGDCLRHEFMHALGFDNHWTGPRATAEMKSVLAHRQAAARSADFSACDELAIRMLYDPRLVPGMSRGAALVAAGDIVERGRRRA